MALLPDTNVVVRMASGTFDPAGILDCSPPVYLCDIILDEAQRQGLTRPAAMRAVMEATRCQVLVQRATAGDRKRATRLERRDSGFHRPDSILAAFAERTKSTLATFDAGLLGACARAGIPAVRP